MEKKGKDPYLDIVEYRTDTQKRSSSSEDYTTIDIKERRSDNPGIKLSHRYLLNQCGPDNR